MTFEDSLFGWFGGKRNLLQYILPFPKHLTYVEVFCGSAVVLYNKEPSPVEIANDINKRLINSWTQACKERRKFLDFALSEGRFDSQQLFYHYRDNVAVDPIEDAFRFYYVNKHSFSQNNKDYHGLSFTGKNNWHSAYLSGLKRLHEIANRLEKTIWISRDFRNVFKRCDKPGTLFYVDPPYFEGADPYLEMAGREEDASWGMTDFNDLRDILSNLEHAKFVLSIDRDDYWLEKMPELYVDPVERVNSASFCVGGTKVKEIEYVIRNFNPNEVETMEQYSAKDKVSDDEVL